MSCTQEQVDAVMASFDKYQTMTFCAVGVSFINMAIWSVPARRFARTQLQRHVAASAPCQSVVTT
jgi:hypothetical protein